MLILRRKEFSNKEQKRLRAMFDRGFGKRLLSRDITNGTGDIAAHEYDMAIKFAKLNPHKEVDISDISDIAQRRAGRLANRKGYGDKLQIKVNKKKQKEIMNRIATKIKEGLSDKRSILRSYEPLPNNQVDNRRIVKYG